MSIQIEKINSTLTGTTNTTDTTFYFTATNDTGWGLVYKAGNISAGEVFKWTSNGAGSVDCGVLGNRGLSGTGVGGSGGVTWESGDKIVTGSFFAIFQAVLDEITTLEASIAGIESTGYGGLYVTDAGALTVDVAAGIFQNAVTGLNVSYAGVAGQALTDDTTNYIELTQAGALNISTSSFTAGNVPLAEVVTSSGDITTVTDKRGLISGGIQTPTSYDWSELTVVAGAATLNLSTAINQYSNFVANTVVTLTGGTEGDVKQYQVVQDSTGSRTITFKVLDYDFGDGDVNTTDDQLTVDVDTATGTRCILTGADLPAPLAAATEYYAIRVDATTIKLATTRANAKAGTNITITDVGSGSRNIYSKPLVAGGGDITLSTDAYAVDNLIVEYDRNKNYVVSYANLDLQ